MNNDFIHYSHLCLRLFLDTGSSNRPNSGHEKGETVTTFSGYNFYEPIISIFTPFLAISYPKSIQPSFYL